MMPKKIIINPRLTHKKILFQYSTINLLFALFITNPSYVLAQVTYKGKVLSVSGKEYTLNSEEKNFSPGSIIVIAKEGQSLELESQLNNFGLNVKERHLEGIVFFVEVPYGFETQWVAVMNELSCVATSSLNKIMSLSNTK